MVSNNLILIMLFSLIRKCYVDNLIIFSNDFAALTTFKQYLCSYFHMKDLDVLEYFLGIDVARNLKVSICVKGSMLLIP